MQQAQVLLTAQDWETCQQAIPQGGLLIFKFSPRCPISRGVEHDFDDWCAQLPADTALRCVKVNVVETRELSQQISQELHVWHESPQAIWLAPDRQVRWDASHRAISPQALTTQLRALAG